jgi:hypothetical protein
MSDDERMADEQRLEDIEVLVRMIVDLDIPDVADNDREVLIQHLTGALFVQWAKA